MCIGVITVGMWHVMAHELCSGDGHDNSDRFIS
jgi:hypothetical protein